MNRYTFSDILPEAQTNIPFGVSENGGFCATRGCNSRKDPFDRGLRFGVSTPRGTSPQPGGFDPMNVFRPPHQHKKTTRKGVCENGGFRDLHGCRTVIGNDASPNITS